MVKFDKNKFVFRELFTNTNGKSSGSGFAGILLTLVAAASFIVAMVGYWMQIPNTLEVMGEILKLIAAATLLLGVRKVTGRIGNGKTEDIYEDNRSPKGERYSDDSILESSKKG